jgi:hypothetical protein
VRITLNAISNLLSLFVAFALHKCIIKTASPGVFPLNNFKLIRK